MSIGVSFPSAGGQSGSNYTVPEPGDTFTQSLTDYLVQVASKALAAPSGADLDLGATWGIKAAYFKSRTANPAASGVLRLAAADAVAFRNQANAADLALAIDAGNALTFAGANVTGNPMLTATTGASPTIGAGATSIVVFGTVEVDSDGAYNSGTGRFTVPTGKGGDYLVEACVQLASTQAGQVNIGVWKNAAIAKYLASRSTQVSVDALSGSAVLRLVAGDVIDIRLLNGGAGGQTLSAVAAINRIGIKRIPT